MTNFVLIYIGGTYPENEEESAAVMAEWGAWYEGMGASIVDGGNPFSQSKSIGSDGAISDGPASNPPATGYTVISADSLDAAVEKTKSHPHTKFGGQISVYETFKM